MQLVILIPVTFILLALFHILTKFISVIATYPEERYSGQRDIEWYNHLVKSLKLEDILAIKS